MLSGGHTILTQNRFQAMVNVQLGIASIATNNHLSIVSICHSLFLSFFLHAYDVRAEQKNTKKAKKKNKQQHGRKSGVRTNNVNLNFM